MRAIARAALMLLILSYQAPARAEPDGEQRGEITMAVRADAPPFIWQDRSTGQYLGFFWDICTEAVQRADYRVKAVSLDATPRRAFLEGGAGDYDLLCDPTTITLERIQNFAKHSATWQLGFSPIVFVANGSFVVQKIQDRKLKGVYVPPAEKADTFDCADLEEQLDQEANQPASSAEEALKPADSDSSTWTMGWSFSMRKTKIRKSFYAYGYLDGATIGHALARLQKQAPKETQICLRNFPTHREAAAAFCKGLLSRYFGDIDIINASLAEYRAFAGVKCEAVQPRPTDVTTYEPYAFVTSARRYKDFPMRFDAALYGMFEDGTVERLFVGHFQTQKSPYLSTLFRINSIPRETTSEEDRAPISQGSMPSGHADLSPG